MGRHTHSLGWVQLLCMSTTNHYICFYFTIWLHIDGQRKIEVSFTGREKKKRQWFLSPGPLGDMEEWLSGWKRHGRGEEQMRWSQICREVSKKKWPACVSEHMCAHTHASTQMDRVSQKVETSRRICLFQLEHIEVYTSDPDIQDIQEGNFLFFFFHTVIHSNCYLHQNNSQDPSYVSRMTACLPEDSVLNSRDERANKLPLITSFITTFLFKNPLHTWREPYIKGIVRPQLIFQKNIHVGSGDTFSST